MKSIKIMVATIITSLALSTGSVQAADDVENAFSQCGIGAAIFQNNETAAIISNIIWDLGTTAVSSMTSSPDSCSGANTTAAIFIDKTHHVLEEQVVKGGGDHLVALMDIMGCDNSHRTDIVSGLRSELATSIDQGKTEAADFGAMVDRVTDGKCAA